VKGELKDRNAGGRGRPALKPSASRTNTEQTNNKRLSSEVKYVTVGKNSRERAIYGRKTLRKDTLGKSGRKKPSLEGGRKPEIQKNSAEKGKRTEESL